MSTPRLDPETKSMIAAALDRFVDDVGDVTDRRKRLAQSPVNERLHWEGLAGLGVFGVAVPEALGGLGGVSFIAQVLGTTAGVAGAAAAQQEVGDLLQRDGDIAQGLGVLRVG